MSTNATLPDPLPSDPLPLFETWLAEARTRRLQPNPDAMVVATVGEQGRPSARVVLCRRVNLRAGFVVFFTNYRSRKGREIEAAGYAAAVLHWDALQRQVRIEGPVVHSPEGESDEYFAGRPLDSRIGAWASTQSEPLASRAELAARVQQTAERFGVRSGATTGEIPRPPHWGGFRLWIETLELWSEGAHRVHDRARWTRTLQRLDEYSFEGGDWQATRLYP